MVHVNLAPARRNGQGQIGATCSIRQQIPDRVRPSGILREVVLMRWLVVGLLVSVGALLFVAVAVTRHVSRQKRAVASEAADLDTQKARNRQLDRALDLGETDGIQVDSLERPAK